MINRRHHTDMFFFIALIALVLAGPLSLVLNEQGDFDESHRNRAWL